MRILHISSGLPEISGGSTFCVELCDKLVAIGHEVKIAILEPKVPNVYPSRQHVPIVSVGAILKSKEGRLFDVVHIHGLWHPVLHKAGVWAQKLGIPVIWSPHGMLAPWAMNHKRWKKWLPWHLYQKRDLKRVSVFLATSEMEVQWIRSFGFAQPCCVVSLGTHLPEAGKTRQSCHETKLTQQSTTEKKVILFVGRIYPVKNLDTLIKAFSLVNPVGKWILVIVGPDQEGHKAELVKIAHSLHMNISDLSDGNGDALGPSFTKSNADIIFTGAVFGEQKDNLYRCADFFALPSHTENFAGVVVDALAFGVPVMVSDKAPWCEVETMNCGQICPTDVDGMTSVLTKMMAFTDEERADMGRRGRLLVERKYTWDAVAEQIVDVYRKMLV